MFFTFILRQANRILLVDDEPDHCLTYQMILQDAGFKCVALCEKIRKVDRDVQIIFITAGEVYYENFRKQYYPEISNDINVNCLRKPIRNQELISIADMTLARKEEK